MASRGGDVDDGKNTDGPVLSSLSPQQQCCVHKIGLVGRILSGVGPERFSRTALARWLRPSKNPTDGQRKHDEQHGIERLYMVKLLPVPQTCDESFTWILEAA